MSRDRDDDWDDEPRERRRRRREDEYDDDYDRGRDRGYGPERSGAVTGAAVINFVVGGLVLLLGLCLMVVFVAAAGEFGRRGGFAFPGVGGGMAILILFAVGLLSWGLGAIVAGIGVVNRRQWGRVLTLVLGGFGILIGLLFLVGAIQILSNPFAGGGERTLSFLISLLIAIAFLGHCIWTYIVLLNSRYGAEFR